MSINTTSAGCFGSCRKASSAVAHEPTHRTWRFLQQQREAALQSGIIFHNGNGDHDLKSGARLKAASGRGFGLVGKRKHTINTAATGSGLISHRPPICSSRLCMFSVPLPGLVWAGQESLAVVPPRSHLARPPRRKSGSRPRWLAHASQRWSAPPQNAEEQLMPTRESSICATWAWVTSNRQAMVVARKKSCA